MRTQTAVQARALGPVTALLGPPEANVPNASAYVASSKDGLEARTVYRGSKPWGVVCSAAKQWRILMDLLLL